MHSQLRNLWFYCNVTSVLCAVALTTLLSFQWPASGKHACSNHILLELVGDYSVVDELSFNSNDLALNYPCGRHENIDLSFWCSLQRDRLIRSSLFDEVQTEVLTEKLAWFTRPAYITALASLWRPSILIAQRKLTI